MRCIYLQLLFEILHEVLLTPKLTNKLWRVMHLSAWLGLELLLLLLWNHLLNTALFLLVKLNFINLVLNHIWLYPFKTLSKWKIIWLKKYFENSPTSFLKIEYFSCFKAQVSRGHIFFFGLNRGLNWGLKADIIWRLILD